MIPNCVCTIHFFWTTTLKLRWELKIRELTTKLLTSNFQDIFLMILSCECTIYYDRNTTPKLHIHPQFYLCKKG